MKKYLWLAACCSILFVLFGCGGKVEKNKEITISAAASLREPLQVIVENFKKEKGIIININFGGSGVLQKQIEQGAPIDIFFPAGKEYMDSLQNKKMIEEASRKDILANSLVYISSKSLKNVTSLQELVNVEGKLALGEVTTVPAGKYAKESLENLGLWNKVEKKVIYAKDVKDVLRYVEIGEAETGIIYKSDSMDLKSSEVKFEIPENTHEPIVYPAAIMSQSANKEICKEFLKYLESSESKRVFQQYKFKVKE